MSATRNLARIEPPRFRPYSSTLALLVLVFTPFGCASVTQDVDAYYRQMQFNYLEAAEKAKADAVTLENERSVLATTGDFSKVKKAQRKLDRLKAWEEKCDHQAKRFEKAAEWTEAHFHLEKPKSVDKPPGTDALEDPTVLQAAGTRTP